MGVYICESYGQRVVYGSDHRLGSKKNFESYLREGRNRYGKYLNISTYEEYRKYIGYHNPNSYIYKED